MIGRLLFFSFLLMGIPTMAQALDLQGHRGARGLLPENTLPAFAKALSIGVTTLEFDTGVAKDGVVVISHDPILNPDITRGRDGNWVSHGPAIKDLTFAELQAFDVGRIKPGSRTADRFPNQTPVDGTRIPSLAQLFELVARSGNETVRFNIETKINPLKPDDTVGPEDFAEALVSTIRQSGMVGRTAIQSFDWRTLQIVRKLEPQIETVYLTAQQQWMDSVKSQDGRPSAWTAGFNLDDADGNVAALIKRAGGDVWSPFYQDLDRTRVEDAQARGLKVIPWTSNDAGSMEDLIDMGVDGIITDYPDILRRVMEQRGLPLPPSTPVEG